MKKQMWVWSMLFFFVTSLLLTISCTQTPVAPEPSVTDSEAEMMAQKAAENARQEEVARQKKVAAAEAERLRLQKEQERLERERVAAEQRAIAAARSRFIGDDTHFDFDSAAIRADAEDLLKLKAGWLKKNPGVSAIIEGHCDERGTNEYNLALGDRRAQGVRQYLVNLGIDGSRLTSISYGEERPVDPGKDEDAWAKNRRAHFTID